MIDDEKLQKMLEQADPFVDAFLHVLGDLTPSEQQVIFLSGAVEAHKNLIGQMAASGVLPQFPDFPQETIVKMTGGIWDVTKELRSQSEPVIFHAGLLMMALTLVYGVLCTREEPDEPAV